MTDIGVFKQSLPAEDLSWDLTPDNDAPYAEGGTLDVSAFNQAQHFPDGFIKSGCVLAVKNGDLVPYLDSAVDSQNVAVGILRASIQVVQPNGQLKTKVGAAVLKAFAVVSASKLPYTAGNAAAGGFLDANGQADLPHIHFAA